VTLVEAADSNGLGGVSLQAIVSHGGCPRDQLHRCVKSAEPLLRNPNYVFPSSNDEVLTVCRYKLKKEKKAFISVDCNWGQSFLILIRTLIGFGMSLSSACEITRRRACPQAIDFVSSSSREPSMRPFVL